MRAPLIALGAAAILVAASAPAEARTKHFALPPFHAIAIDGAAHLDFTEGPAQSVTATARPSLLRRVRIRVRDGVLHVDERHGLGLFGRRRLDLVVSAPALDRIGIDGAVSGWARDLSGATFVLSLSGAGSMTLAGTVANVSVSISGAGSVDARSLMAKDLVVRLSGAGSLRAYASQSCHVSISGAGSVAIAGNPKIRQITNSGVGSVSFD